MGADPGPDLASESPGLTGAVDGASPTGQRFGVRVPGRPLADALCWVARWHGVTATPGALLSGLPLIGADLAPGAVVEAASRAGLRAIVSADPVAKLPDLVFPVIAILTDGEVVVVRSRGEDRGTARLVRFTPDGKPEDADERAVPQALAVVLVTPSDAPSRAGGPGRDAGSHWLWTPAARFWPDYGQVLAAALFLNLLGLALPLFMMNVFDRVIPNLALTTLWTLFLGVVLAMVFEFLFRSLRSAILDEVARRLDIAVAGRLFDQLLRIDLQYRPRSSGAIASQIREFEAVRELVTTGVVTSVIDSLFIVLFIAVMWLIVGPLALVPAAGMALIAVVTLVMNAPLSRAIEAGQAQHAQRSSVLVDTAAGLETVKALGAESVMRAHFNRAVAASSRALSRARFWASVSASAAGEIQQFVSVGIVLMGVFMVLDGSITVGALIAANLLAGRAMAPVSGIAQTLTRLMQARAAVASIDRFMSLPIEAGPAARAGLTPGSGSFVCKRLGFAYPGASEKALDAIDLVVRSGERIGIIGRVGSGKSTLGRLLAGLYRPTEGALLVDDVDVRQYDPAELRAAVGYCQQEPDLFAGSVLDNVLIGRPMAGEAELRSALEASGLDDVVRAHPQGLAMAVAERGRSLSGGQRQAVALARVIIRQPRILFLDEPSASLDSVSEARLVQRLSGLAAKGTTLLIATHRDPMLALVDRILVFEGGRIVLDGPRDEVLARLRRAPPSGGS